MDSTANLHTLIEVALNEFDQPANTVSASVRRAVRIASLRRDYANQLWLQFELTDPTPVKTLKRQDPAIARIMAQLGSLLGAEESRREHYRAYAQFEQNRAYNQGGRDLLLPLSVGQLEQSIAMFRKIYDDLTVPANLTQLDTYFVAKEMDASKAKLLPGMQQEEQILERIRTAVHAFLVTSEGELIQGQQESSLFLRAQEYINSALQKYAPDALGKFIAAQDRILAGEPEDLAHALTSCRRMIKSLADALYPSSGSTVVGEDGIERMMSDDAYRNRLLQYVREQLGRSGRSSVIQKTLDNLGARLKSLDSLASKGVHDEVSSAEAETCIIWTYLLAADIVRIADGSSILLSAEDGS